MHYQFNVWDFGSALRVFSIFLRVTLVQELYFYTVIVL